VELKELGLGDEKILVVVGSMECPETPAKIIDATVAKFGRIDVLVLLTFYYIYNIQFR
jgi:hypothetical protein